MFLIFHVKYGKVSVFSTLHKIKKPVMHFWSALNTSIYGSREEKTPKFDFVFKIYASFQTER